MAKRIRVGILFGGKSAEHEISLLSAKSVIEAIDKEKYELILIGIHPSGEWFLYDNIKDALLWPDDPKRIQLQKIGQPVTLINRESGAVLINLLNPSLEKPIEVFFPVLHGTYGEDGTIQGWLKLMNVPFVGAGVMASAIGMDKDVMKRLLRDAGIPIAPFLTFKSSDVENLLFEDIQEAVGLPFFIKPANLGSSVGVSKVKNKQEFKEKIKYAFQFDHKILIETYIAGREIECSVLGNETPMASLPGELIPSHEFYSYEAKYLDEQGARIEVPASLTEQEVKAIQNIAIKTYQVLCCEGMARVDLFLQKDGRIVVNEINTIPGFTKISMYPKMWSASGLSYSALIDRLIKLAIKRFEKEQQLKTVVTLLPLSNKLPVADDLE